MEIKKISMAELSVFKELIRLFEDVFEMKDFRMPSDKYLGGLLNTESFFVYVALADGKVVGGLTSYILPQYYSERPLVYIFDLAVRADMQRKGIGRKLIEANNAYAAGMNAEVVMVQADVPDKHAIEFYRSTGAKAEEVIHFDYVLDPKS